MFPDAAEGAKQPFHNSDAASNQASQFLAMEGQCFVILATEIVTEKDIERLGMKGIPFTIPGGGFYMIFGPDGRELAKGLGGGEEGIVTADVDLKDIDYAKAMIDTVGHYASPDFLSLLVNPRD